jgi:hypothetical protein
MSKKSMSMAATLFMPLVALLGLTSIGQAQTKKDAPAKSRTHDARSRQSADTVSSRNARYGLWTGGRQGLRYKRVTDSSKKTTQILGIEATVDRTHLLVRNTNILPHYAIGARLKMGGISKGGKVHAFVWQAQYFTGKNHVQDLPPPDPNLPSFPEPRSFQTRYLVSALSYMGQYPLQARASGKDIFEKNKLWMDMHATVLGLQSYEEMTSNRRKVDIVESISLYAGARYDITKFLSARAGVTVLGGQGGALIYASGGLALHAEKIMPRYGKKTILLNNSQ